MRKAAESGSVYPNLSVHSKSEFREFVKQVFSEEVLSWSLPNQIVGHNNDICIYFIPLHEIIKYILNYIIPGILHLYGGSPSLACKKLPGHRGACQIYVPRRDRG